MLLDQVFGGGIKRKVPGPRGEPKLWQATVKKWVEAGGIRAKNVFSVVKIKIWVLPILKKSGLKWCD